MTTPEELHGMATAILPDWVEVVVATPPMFDEPLLGEELAGTGRMVPKRLREFTGGRVAARRAIEQLGFPETPIPTAPSRAPIWPQGVTGSISHSGSACLAVVAPNTRARSLGVDVELLEPLSSDLRPMICTPEEEEWLKAFGPGAGNAAKLIFSAKETVYKCWAPIEEEWLDFHEATLELDMDEECWTARLLKEPTKGFPSRLSGRFSRQNGLILTAAVVQTGDI